MVRWSTCRLARCRHRPRCRRWLAPDSVRQPRNRSPGHGRARSLSTYRPLAADAKSPICRQLRPWTCFGRRRRAARRTTAPSGCWPIRCLPATIRASRGPHGRGRPARRHGARRGNDGDTAALPRLPSTRREAAAIAAAAGTSAALALDFEATRTAALDAATGRARVVHFATHAVVDTARPSSGAFTCLA